MITSEELVTPADPKMSAAVAVHSLPFIEWSDSSRKFVVNEDGARYLSSFEDKIGAQ